MNTNKIPAWLQVAGLVAGGILIVIGMFRIFGSGGTGAPNALAAKFNEFQAPTLQIRGDLAQAGDLLRGIDAKEQAKDYAGAVTDLQLALAKLDDATNQLAKLQTVESSLRDMTNASPDSNVKIAGVDFVDAAVKRDAVTLQSITDIRQLVTMAMTYYDGLAKGKAITMDEAKFTDAASRFATDTQALLDAGKVYDTAAQAFARAGGFELEQK